MRRASRLPYSLDQDAYAGSVLGADHPLVRAQANLKVAIERCAVVSALLALGVFALMQDVPIAAPLAAAALAVLAMLLVQAAALVWERNECALKLIADGKGDVSLVPVERVKERLLRPGYGARLARSVDEIRQEVERPVMVFHPIRPMYSVRVIRSAGPDLEEVARLLRTTTDPRALARAELLITDGRSPLYRDDAEVLRQELGCIRFFLES
jgi:hypothetical protein